MFVVLTFFSLLQLQAQTKYTSVVKYNDLGKAASLCQVDSEWSLSYNPKQKLFLSPEDTIQKARENKQTVYACKSEKLVLDSKTYTIGSTVYTLRKEKIFDPAGEVLLSSTSTRTADRFTIELTLHKKVTPEHLDLLLVAFWEAKLEEEKSIFHSNQIMIY